MKVSDVLTDESKWVKGIIKLGQRRCLDGALAVTYRSGEQYREARANVVAVIRVLFPERIAWMPDGLDGLPNFNDHPCTTFEDIQRVVKVADV